jgi:hypothetical protein
MKKGKYRPFMPIRPRFMPDHVNKAIALIFIAISLTIASSMIIGYTGCGGKAIGPSEEPLPAEEIIAKSKESMSNIESAHITNRKYFRYEDEYEQDVFEEAEYYLERPDKTHIIYNAEYYPECLEKWYIGDTMYIKYSFDDIEEEELDEPYEVSLNELHVFDSEEPEKLADTVIDGVECAVITAEIPPIDPKGEYRVTYYIRKSDYRIVRSVLEILYAAEITGEEIDYWEISETVFLEYNNKHDFFTYME